jgi:hypothetical protein
LEEVHIHFQKETLNRLTRDNEGTVKKDSFVFDWPWGSKKRWTVERGNVASLMKDHDELEQVLGALEDEEEMVLGRTSTATKDNVDTEHERVVANGNVEDIFNNYHHLEDIIEFTQEPLTAETPAKQPPSKLDASTQRQEGDELQSPVVPFIGIDKMIASQESMESQEEEEDEDENPLTQAETFETALEELEDEMDQPFTQAEPVFDTVVEDLDAQPKDTTTTNGKDDESEPPLNSQDVSLTNSQLLNPEQYFSANETEEVIKSQSPKRKRVTKRIKSKKIVRYSQVPIYVKKRHPKSNSNKNKTADGGAKPPPEEHTIRKGYDSDDSSWMKIKKKTKPRVEHPESQVAGEGSEENSPQDVEDAVFDCNQDEELDEEKSSDGCESEQTEQVVDDKQQQPEEPVNKHDDDPHVHFDLNPSTAVLPADEPRKVVREFDMDRFLLRSKRLCKR